jgi:hypothetical protein
MFLGLQDPDPSEVWIRIRLRALLSSGKNSKKNLDSYCFVTSFGLFILDPNPDPLVRGMDPRIRIHAKMSWIRKTAYKKKAVAISSIKKMLWRQTLKQEELFFDKLILSINCITYDHRAAQRLPSS